MLTIISFILKIIFSVLISFLTFYYQKLNFKKHLSELLLFNFFVILILSPIYSISNAFNSVYLYGIALIIITAFLIYYLSTVKADINLFNYILALIIAVLMSLGYFVYTIVCVLMYLFLLNYIIPLLKENEENEKDNSNENDN